MTSPPHPNRLLLCRMPSEGGRKVGEPRLVVVRRPGVEVGVTLCGGNLRGVYIESVDEDSPARSPDGLLPGDLILEVSETGRAQSFFYYSFYCSRFCFFFFC